MKLLPSRTSKKVLVYILELERILTKSFTSDTQKTEKEKMFRFFFLPHNESGQLIGKSNSLKQDYLEVPDKLLVIPPKSHRLAGFDLKSCGQWCLARKLCALLSSCKLDHLHTKVAAGTTGEVKALLRFSGAPCTACLISAPCYWLRGETVQGKIEPGLG